MIHVTLYRASSLSADVVEDLCIQTFQPMPDDHAPGLFEEQARELVVALGRTLPGGTMDQLLVELLRRKASQLVVRDKP